MSIETTPWMIKGGAKHSASLGRSLAAMALGDTREGVAGAGHLAVRATSPVSPNVRVDKGVFAIRNTYASEFGQTYVGRAPSETVSPAFAATTATPRSDMLILRIDDPEFGGTVPEVPVDGIYQFLDIISNVGSSAVTLPSGLGYPAIALARIDLPAGTTNITQAMIKDLRALPNPRRSEEMLTRKLTATNTLDVTATAGEKWPASAGHNVTVPEWATAVYLKGTITGSVSDANSLGQLWGQFGEYGTPGAVATPEVDYNTTSTTERNTYVVGGRLAIPAPLRGTVVNVAIRGRKQSGGNPYGDTGTSTIIELAFIEEPVVE